jgi:glycosyltransferase involved in cell wall biosynthesis
MIRNSTSITNFSNQSEYDVAFLVTRSDTIGGVHTHILQLCKILKRYNITFCIIAGESENSIFFKRLDSLNIPYIPLGCLQRKITPFKDILSVVKLSRLLHELNPKVVWLHSSKAGLIGRLSFYSKQKCLFTVHGWSFFSSSNLFAIGVYRLLEYFLQIFASRIIVVSKFDYRNGIANYISRSRLTLIYNSSDRYSGGSVIKPVSDVAKILCIARLDSQKDHFTLFKALSLLPSTCKWSLDCVGDGPLYDHLIHLGTSLGIIDRITFHGFADDTSQFYHSSDIFVLPTNFEGLPITIIEALSYSLPIISADVSGCPELVFSSVNGFLYPKNSYYQLSKYIHYLILFSSERQRMGAASKYIFEKYFSFPRFEDQTISMLRSTSPSLFN